MPRKTIRKSVFICILALVMLVSAIPCRVRAEEDPDHYIRQMILYYQHYRENAATDLAFLLESLRELDPEKAAAWERILDYWAWVYEEMDIPTQILPDGLPEDDSLCIVVLGFRLNYNGSISDELLGRLEMALACAEKYPNAYILCTGGATASQNQNVTEAGEMARWLIRHGIAQSRIIQENNSYSTIQNAIRSCEILHSSYPQIRHLAMVTSDYHMWRGCLYFFTQSALYACDAGVDPLDIVSCAAYEVQPDEAGDIAIQAEGLSILADITLGNEVPTLSRLEDIHVTGATRYEPGEDPELTVTASYDSGYSRDVTESATFWGIDFNLPGEQTLTVSYEENGIVRTAPFDIEIIAPATEAAAVSEPVPAPESSVQPPAGEASPNRTAAAVVMVACGTLACLLILRQRALKKRRRRRRPRFNPD